MGRVTDDLFLVLGRAVPEGPSVYVVMRDSRKSSRGGMGRFGPDEFLVICPCSGHVYSAADTCCPLKEIMCLATPHNIWANVQFESRPCDVSYNVANTDAWRPFFGARMPLPQGGLQSIQEDIKYTETSEAHCLEVENLVRGAIKTRFRMWRSKRHRSVTTFHPDASAILHDALPALENWCRTADAKTPREPTRGRVDAAPPPAVLSTLDVLQSQIEDRMRTILRTRTLKGCPHNIPFSDTSEIMDKIKALRVHESQHPEVQFVAAVRAFPIANGIVSLWVFLGTLETIPHGGGGGVATSPPRRR